MSPREAADASLPGAAAIWAALVMALYRSQSATGLGDRKAAAVC